MSNLICESKKQHSEHQHTENNIELSIALDFCASIFVFINRQGIVNYMNFKALRFFETHAEQFMQYDSEFNPHTVMGDSVVFFDHLFKSKPDLFSLNLGEEYKTLEQLGDIFIEIKYTPICNHTYEIIGLSLEINDVTSFVKTKQMFKNAIERAKLGDFSNRIETNYDQNFCIFKDIFTDINDLFDNIDDFFQNVIIGLEHFSAGDLNYSIPTDVSAIQTNTFELIKNDINYTTEKLKSLVLDVHTASTTMNHMIGSLASINSEASMSIETQFVEASKNKEELEQQLNFLQNNTTQIVQTISDINLYRDNSEQLDCIENLKVTLDAMGKRISDIEEVAVSMEMFFTLHLKGLQTGLHEIEIGSLGKGIKIIQQEVDLIIGKSTSAMSQIKSSLSKLSIDFNFHSSQSVDKLLKGLTLDLTDMQNTIRILSETLAMIENMAHQQESTFDHFNELTTHIDELRNSTMTNIESIILSTCEIVSLGDILDASIHSFDIDELKEQITQDQDIELNKYHNIDMNQSVVLLWNDE